MSAESFPLSWPDGWPRTPMAKRGKSRFVANTYDQIRMIHRELKLLKAKNVVVSSNVPLRQDGMPYADYLRRRYDDPGVAVYFTLKDRNLCMARDAYWTPFENMRSLVMTVSGMRQIERHGGSAMMEKAFSGFIAIAPPDWKKPWREVFGLKADASVDPKDLTALNSLYRAKARNRHPDAGGSEQLMAELNVAYEEAKREIGA